MKDRRRSVRFISLLCALSLFAVQPGFAATKSVTKLKSAGRTANSIPNTILNGLTPPAKSIGINGDFYIDIKNLNIYGPKKNNSWPVAISLRGTAGTDGKTGTPGVAGADGKTITNTSTVGGGAGTPGATGATGATGTNGSNGAAGVAGANGAAGETGAAGASGSAGPAGPPGPAGSTGETGSAGAPGAAGTNGAPGLSGITSISVGMFTFINPLTGATTVTAVSNNFGSMLAGKKYAMHLVISGVNSNFVEIATTLKLELTSTAGAIPITSAYFLSVGKKYVSGIRFTQNIFADLVIDGSAVTDPFDLIATVSATDVLASTVTLSGYFTLTEIGSIT